MAAMSVVTPAEAPISNVVAPHQNSSLYVGDLDRDVTEAQLYELFSQVGPVASIRVCRDAVTRRSLGYAYVNYNSALDPQAAERALETLNYTPVSGRPIRIMWSHRDPSFRKSGVGNIFIKNLDKSIDNKALHDTFSQFGMILSCKVAQDASGQSKGYGFVHFETEEAANLAIEKVNGMQLQDKIVYVGPFLKRQERPDNSSGRFTNVYVKNLDPATTDKEFEEMCEVFGEITSAVVMKDDKGNSRGFGFVNFKDTESAKRAVKDLNGKKIPGTGKDIFAGPAQKRGERQAQLRQQYDEKRQERIAKYEGMNLYVKNLGDDVDDDMLREEFSTCGNITSARVMRDEKGKSRGFGFVCFSNGEEATRAVSDMNMKMLKGKPLYVALAQRKEVRRAQLEQRYATGMVIPNRPGAPGGALPGVFPPGPPMFYAGAGRGMPQGPGGPGGMMYPPMMQGPRGMAPQGRVGRGGMMPQQNLMMMNMGAGPVMGRGTRGRGRPGREGPKEGQPVRPRNQGRGERQGRGPAPQVPPPAVPPPAPAPPAQPAVMVAPPAPTEAAAPSLAAMLANASPNDQKQMLGERLFPQVSRLQPDLAGKITGMLLEMDNSEVLLLLENPDALLAKVDEAIAVLKQHNVIPADA